MKSIICLSLLALAQANTLKSAVTRQQIAIDAAGDWSVPSVNVRSTELPKAEFRQTEAKAVRPTEHRVELANPLKVAEGLAGAPEYAQWEAKGVKWEKFRKGQKLSSDVPNQRLGSKDTLGLYQLAHTVALLLDRHELQWFADGGTLLGAVRNKGIIPHDDDVDYGILHNQSEALASQGFLQSLEKNKLKIHKVMSGFWHISPVDQDPNHAWLHVDLFSMKDFSGKLHYSSYMSPSYHLPASMCKTSAGVTPDGVPKHECALIQMPFGVQGFVKAPKEDVTKECLDRAYGNWREEVSCDGPSEQSSKNHPCELVGNSTHELTQMASPSGPLSKPV